MSINVYHWNEEITHTINDEQHYKFSHNSGLENGCKLQIYFGLNGN